MSYIKRTFDKYDNEDENAYLKRIDTVLSVINNEVFYKPEYKDITERYFKTKYKQEEKEKGDKYFKRLLTKKSYETLEIYVRRIKYLQLVFPDLECWQTFEFDESSNDGYSLRNILVSVST